MHLCGWFHRHTVPGSLQKGLLRERMQSDVRLYRGKYCGLQHRHRVLQLQARMARFVEFTPAIVDIELNFVIEET